MDCCLCADLLLPKRQIRGRERESGCGATEIHHLRASRSAVSNCDGCLSDSGGARRECHADRALRVRSQRGHTIIRLKEITWVSARHGDVRDRLSEVAVSYRHSFGLTRRAKALRGEDEARGVESEARLNSNFGNESIAVAAWSSLKRV